MKNLLSIAFLILIAVFSKAESWELTVIAKQGLSMHEEPNQGSKRITMVRFGELVWSRFYPEYFVIKEVPKLDTIGGTVGFWMKVRYQEYRGFMFTGYLVYGDIFPLSRIDTIPIIVIDEFAEYDVTGVYRPGFYNQNNYSPNMLWYGVKILDTNTIVTRTDVVPIYNQNRWHPSDTNRFDVKLSIEGQEDFDFVFGTKDKFVPSEIKSRKYFDLNSNIGIFVYPEQRLAIFPKQSGYQLCAREIIVHSDRPDQEFKRTYNLSLLHWQDTIPLLNFKKVFNLSAPASRHAVYHSPEIYWSGDLNNDGHPDMILKSQPMSDTCGSWPFLYLVMSQDRNGMVEYYATSTWMDIENIK